MQPIRKDKRFVANEMNQLTILISLYFLNCFAETSIKENDISYEKQHNEEKVRKKL